jgi:hypothetical protein
MTSPATLAARPPRPSSRMALRLSVLALAALVACGGGQDSAMQGVDEDRAALVTPRSTTAAPTSLDPARREQQALAAAPASSRAATQCRDARRLRPGAAWPLMPIHQVLLPDGRVLTYGSDITASRAAAALRGLGSRAGHR